MRLRAPAVLLLLAWPCAGQTDDRVRLVVETGQPRCDAAAISPNGRLALGGCEDSTAWLWDLSTYRLLRRFTGHTGSVRNVAFSPDNHLALTTGGLRVRVWDLATGKEIRHFEPAPGTSVFTPAAGAFSADGRTALIAIGNTARLCDIATGAELRAFSGHSDFIVAVAVSSNGQLALTGASDGTARLWDMATGRELRKFDIPRVLSLEKTKVAFSPDGKFAAFATDHGIRADLADALQQRILNNGAASGTVRTVVQVWDIESGKEVGRLPGYGAAFSPDGRLVVTGGSSAPARIWDISSGKQVGKIDGFPSDAGEVAFSADGRLSLTGDSFGNRLWDFAAGKPLAQLRGHTVNVELSSDHRLVIAGSGDRSRAWDLSTGKQVDERPPRAELTAEEVKRMRDFCQAGPHFHFAVSRAHGIVLTGETPFGARELRVCNLDTGTPVRNLSVAGDEQISFFALSPDGRLALAGYWGNHAELWDVATGNEVRRFSGESGSVESLAFSSDSQSAIIAAGGIAYFWDLATGKELQRLKGPVGGIWRVAISRDSRFAVTVSYDRTARVWDLATGRQLQSINCGYEPQMVAFDITGRLLVTSGEDQTVQVWNVGTGRQLATIASFDDRSWAVTDSEGRYDAADPDNAIGMHWVAGEDVIELGQLKQRFYTPGLLARVIQNEILPNVAGIQTIPKPPQIDAEAPSVNGQTVKIHLSDRGGGLGRLVISVNGREVPATVRGETIDPKAASQEITLHLDRAVARPDGENIVEIRAFDAQGVIASRGVIVAYQTRKQEPPTHFYAVVAGTSEYAADALHLQFAAKDAEVMANALRLAAEGLFTPERVDVRVFATGSKAEATKENLRQAFADIAGKALPGDILVVYFAGHGVTVQGAADRYFYLTRDARSTALPLNDPSLLNLVSVSSEELREWCWRIKALKQVFVLDTCAAGGAVGELGKLSYRRELSPDQQRAIELLKDATGSHILMGSAADASSYEAGRYGQGLLTYAVLSGLKGAALVEGGRVDVRRLFDFAQHDVEQLAHGIGGVQRPQVSSPQGSTFPIGFLSEERRKEIPLATAKAQLSQLRCHDQADHDPLHLEATLRAALREVSEPVTRGGGGTDPPLIYLDSADEIADALAPRVTYQMKSRTVELTIRLDRGDKTIWEKSLSSSADDVPAIAKQVVEAIIQAANEARPAI